MMSLNQLKEIIEKPLTSFFDRPNIFVNLNISLYKEYEC